MDWTLIVICIIGITIIGCKGVDKLTGTGQDQKQEVPTKKMVRSTVSPIHVEYAGIFTDDNFVEINIPPDWDDPSMDVIILRKGEKIKVYPYTKKADDEGHPYYVHSETGGLVFLNHQYGDEYQVFVYK